MNQYLENMNSRIGSADSPMKSTRKRQGITGRELAFFTGSSPIAISRLERGLGGSAALMARVARVLRVPVEELWPRDASEVSRD